MHKFTKAGLIGAIVAAICCFTPLLVWALAAVGLSGLVAYLDAILFPALGAFLGLAAYGFKLQRKAS